MKTTLFYYKNNGFDRSLINLCSCTPVNKYDSKLKFYVLPDRQMSFLKILDLPPSPENKLRDMVRFLILKIYPDSNKDIPFDFIPYKTKTGWKIVLYILKKKYLNEVLDNERFGGIVLPLQLLPKDELHTLSNLIIIYPGMVEVWMFVNGIPDRVKREDPERFLIQDSLIRENQMFKPEKLMIIYPYNETPKLEIKNGRTKEFSECLDYFRQEEIYFPEYGVKKLDRITPVITITAFIFSLVLLAISASEYQKLVRVENDINLQSNNIHIETKQNKELLELIEKLENELKHIREDTSINIYNLLLRISKVLDSSSELLSFGLKGKELTLTLRGKSALIDLAGIKNEFGNMRSSNIRILADGNKSYTVWVGIE